MSTGVISPNRAASGPDADGRPDIAGSSEVTSRPIHVPSLPFPPHRMVDWFSPVELGRTGIRAMLAEVLGSYADKRELQAALHQSTDTPFTTPCARRVPECTEMWLDYVADVGDGFNTTFSVAWLLSRDELELEGLPQPAPRADVLVLGGDQVYTPRPR